MIKKTNVRAMGLVWLFCITPVFCFAQTAVPPANMVQVFGGAFQMGSNNDLDADAKPPHTVTVKSFYIGKTEVTQKEWNAVMERNPSAFKGDNLPVETVSWLDAVEFCNTLSRKEGLTPAYRINGNDISCDFNANGYRLPTEAEWEYAAKGGGMDSVPYMYSGGNNPDTVGWYTRNSGGKTHPVGTKAANSLGIYDMSGNVWEWCWDWYARYGSGSQTDPRGPSRGAARVVRGGSWLYWPPGSPEDQCLRPANRRLHPQDRMLGTIGFRLARSGL